MLCKVTEEIQIYYETYGDKNKNPTLLIHGLGADHNMWKPQISTYPKYGLYLIVPDIRGHGKSSKVSKFNIDDCANDIFTLVKTLKIESVNIVGISMGGIIAQQFTLNYPNNVDKLIICDSFSKVVGFSAKFNAWLAAKLLDLIPKNKQMKLIENKFNEQTNEHKNIREYFKCQLLEMDSQQLKFARKTVNEFDVEDRLRGIRVPTLVMVGNKNPKWFMKLTKIISENISNAQFQIIEGGSDPSNLTASNYFDSSVRQFLI